MKVMLMITNRLNNYFLSKRSVSISGISMVTQKRAKEGKTTAHTGNRVILQARRAQKKKKILLS